MGLIHVRKLSSPINAGTNISNVVEPNVGDMDNQGGEAVSNSIPSLEENTPPVNENEVNPEVLERPVLLEPRKVCIIVVNETYVYKCTR